MHNRIFLAIAIGLFAFSVQAQSKLKVVNGGVTVSDTGQETPDPTAVMDVSSESKGFLFPRLTTIQRDQITNPAEGLVIYNLTIHCLQIFNGTTWLDLYATGVLIVAPTGIVAVAVSSSQIDLTWADNSSEEEGFEVEQSINGTDWQLIHKTAENVDSYNVTGLMGDTRYYFRVRAVGSGNLVSAYSLDVSAVTLFESLSNGIDGDGVNDYMTTGLIDMATGDEWTFVMWIKVSYPAAEAPPIMWTGEQGGSGTTDNLGVYYSNSGGNVIVAIYGEGGSSPKVYFVAPALISDGDILFISAKMEPNGEDFKYTINHKNVTQSTSFTAATTVSYQHELFRTLTFNRQTNRGERYSGNQFGQFWFWNEALTTEDWEKLYNLGQANGPGTIAKAPLIDISFDAQVGGIISDSGPNAYDLFMINYALDPSVHVKPFEY